jgi:hypothetical protein
MKKPLIVLVQHKGNSSNFDLTRLLPVLEPTGYQVEVCTCHKAKLLLPAPGRISPDLLIVDHRLSSGNALFSGKDPSTCPQIVLSEEKKILIAPFGKVNSQEFPIDIIALHELIGECLVHYPRKNLRICVHLPCYFSSKGISTVGKILSLGTGGAFIKPMCRHVLAGDIIELGIPLLGMKKELELPSRVIYRQEATPENNYLQGLGVEFLPMCRETTLVLHDFLKRTLLNDLDPMFSCWGMDGSQSTLSAASCMSAPFRLDLRN